MANDRKDIPTIEPIERSSEQHGPFAAFENLYHQGTEYLETQAELLKLRGTKKVSKFVSWGAANFIMAFIFVFFFLILNIGIGLWLGELLGKSFYGFFALAGFYLVVGLILIFFNQALIKNPVSNAIIKKLVDDDD